MPIPYTGRNKFFSVNMSEMEMETEGMKDKNSIIRYNIIFEQMLPRFDGKLFWDFLAPRMQSYMMHLMLQGWKLHWYNPGSRNVILMDHVACMFGCQQCQLIQGFPLINNSWSTQCPIDAFAPLKEYRLHNAFTDMYWCINFADDFDGDKMWSDIFFA